MSVPERLKNYSKNLTLVTLHKSVGTTLLQPPCFNGVVQSLTLPRNALILRQELCKLLEKGAINDSQRESWSTAFPAAILWCPREMEDSTRYYISGPSTECSASVRSGQFCWNRSWRRFAPRTGCVRQSPGFPPSERAGCTFFSITWMNPDLSSVKGHASHIYKLLHH